MAKNVGCLLGLGLGLLLGAPGTCPAADDQVVRDARGRVSLRLTTNADKSSHRTTFQYGSDSAKPLIILDEDLDPVGRTTKRVEQRFDSRGRLEEKLDVEIDATDKQTGNRTRYSYDPSGRRFKQVTAVK